MQSQIISCQISNYPLELMYMMGGSTLLQTPHPRDNQQEGKQLACTTSRWIDKNCIHWTNTTLFFFFSQLSLWELLVDILLLPQPLGKDTVRLATCTPKEHLPHASHASCLKATSSQPGRDLPSTAAWQPSGQRRCLRLYKPPTLNCYVWHKYYPLLLSGNFSVKLNHTQGGKGK